MKARLLNSYMKFTHFLIEGGKAIKVSKPIKKADAERLVPQLHKMLSDALGVPVHHVGSAGLKDESGDIDFVVGIPDLAKTLQGSREAALVKLGDMVRQMGLEAHQHDPKDQGGKYFFISPQINLYSFAYPYFSHDDRMRVKFAQVDVMAVEDPNWAIWSHHNHAGDLSRGFKGAHRNELMFAVAKHANQKVTANDEEGQPLEIERYFYDPHRGLLRGKQTRMGNKGKPTKDWNTIGEKKVVTTDPDEASRIMFGPRAKSKNLLSFDDVWAAMHHPSFPHKDALWDMKNMAKEGTAKKKLSLPMELDRLRGNEGMLG